MILYLDASALIKRYILEKFSEDVNSWINAADMVVTSLLTRVEIAAAISRAGRMELISTPETLAALHQFRSEWESFYRLQITESTIVRGDTLAAEYNLRGYDATHLASALMWQETLGIPVTLASFDNQLIEAAREIQMDFLPT